MDCRPLSQASDPSLFDGEWRLPSISRPVESHPLPTSTKPLPITAPFLRIRVGRPTRAEFALELVAAFLTHAKGSDERGAWPYVNLPSHFSLIERF